MGRRRKQEREPQGYSKRPWGAAYNMILRKVGVKGKDKKAILNDFALCTAAAAGLCAGVFAGMAGEVHKEEQASDSGRAGTRLHAIV